MSLTLYFVRHGQTLFSREDILSGGATDLELTPAGEQMAQDFAAEYRDLAFSAVFVSPLRRTLATARPICRARGIIAVVSHKATIRMPRSGLLGIPLGHFRHGL